MIETLLKPESEMFPNRYRWTKAQCDRMVEIGFITGRYELIDGEILSKMGQHAPHATTIILLNNWLAAIFGNLFLRVQLPVQILGADGETNEPEPDLAVTCESATEYTEENPTPQDIRLIAEVADSSLRLDKDIKARLYARNGIPEYWIMDVNGRQIYRHREPSLEGYREIVILDAEQSVSPLGRTETVRVGDLFPAPRPAAE